MPGHEHIEQFLQEIGERTLLRFSTAGSVDDGKSTLIGRLLHDSKNIFEDTLSAVRRSSKSYSGGELDLALVTDGLKAEREQKITIDVAYRYFSTPKRNFILADTPGHVQYTRNMATGASTADAAILLIDATRGVLTQTRRHAFILTLLGIRHVIVAVNKMDMVGYERKVFEDIRKEFSDFSAKLGVTDIHFIPISALNGDNVVQSSDAMNWYHGESILQYLENLYIGGDRNLIDLRFPVQCVIRPDQHFRGFSGQIASGVIRKGDSVLALPSMKSSRIRSIVTFDGELDRAFAPMSVTVTLEDEIDISSGDMIVHPNNVPRVDSTLEAMLVWMSEKPLDARKTYLLRQTTRDGKVTILSLRYRVDVDTLRRHETDTLQINEIGRVMLQNNRPLFFDPYDRNRNTGCFVLIDPQDHETVGAGMILDRATEENLRKGPSYDQDVARIRNIRKEEGQVSQAERESALGHRAVCFWMTGLSGSGKSTISASLEKSMFDAGHHVYRLDGDNIRFGLNRDLGFSDADRRENIRRVAEVARLMNQAGISVVTSFISPFREDRAMARAIIGEDAFIEVFVDAPLEVCEQRDSKGLYRKARAGEISEFTGVTSPYEPPENPAVAVQTDRMSVEECVDRILKTLHDLGENQD
jgi:bifunctional enzyme CysN/CysC